MSTVPLDIYIHEIDKMFITVKNSSSQFEIFKTIFDNVIIQMKEVDYNFKKYLSKIQFSGSFWDGVKVGKLDEFDMNIIIKLPVDYSNVKVSPQKKKPGFVTLEMVDLEVLRRNTSWANDNKVMLKWFDKKNHFLNGPFLAWMEGIVAKALNKLEGQVKTNGVTYHLTLKKGRVAITLHCESDNSQTCLDVDIVPAIEFPSSQWPAGYRKWHIHGDTCNNTWLAIPKSDKSISDEELRNRCWKVGFLVQEGDLIRGSDNLKPTIRLMKKLRDTLKMDGIASYFIKTLFMWEVIAQQSNVKYWQQKQSILFKHMLEKFHEALAQKSIPFFWHDQFNLIGNLKPEQLNEYREKVKKVLVHVQQNSIVDIVHALLTEEDLEKFKVLDIYKAAVDMKK